MDATVEVNGGLARTGAATHAAGPDQVSGKEMMARCRRCGKPAPEPRLRGDATYCPKCQEFLVIKEVLRDGRRN